MYDFRVEIMFGSFFYTLINMFCMYLRILVSNRISRPDDVRVIKQEHEAGHFVALRCVCVIQSVVVFYLLHLSLLSFDHCIVFTDLQLLITLWYHLITPLLSSDYPFGIF